MNSKSSTYFISGHLSLTEEEFKAHYKPKIDAALENGGSFVVGDARGADKMAQMYLADKIKAAIVYHMFESPCNNAGYQTIGGFKSDEARDAQMTRDSDFDIAWVRLRRENSGTQKNIDRRQKLAEK